MANMQKITYTYWTDRNGKRVKAGTKGAKKVTEESAKWYAVWREGGRHVKRPLSTDKESSQAMMADLLRAKARGEAGLVDPYKEHLDRAVTDHIEDYLAVVTSNSRSVEYHREMRRILTHFVDNSGVRVLREVTADKVSSYLAKMKTGPTTKNYHRRLIVQFMGHMEAIRRIPFNPITAKSVKTADTKKGKKRKRWAMNADQIQRLLVAVREYPVKAASVNKGGRFAKQRPAERQAKLKPETLAKLEHRGRERWLMYRLALYTGLRRIELSRLRVHHLELDRKPYARIDLPGHLTKNGKDAKILLVPYLAEDLRQWIQDTGKGPNDPVVYVPCKGNISKLHRAHMKLAGIQYKDDQGRFADFHSLRTAANVLLRQAGIPAKERQLFMRHGKLELTTETYDDEDATQMNDVVKALENTRL